MYPGVMQLPFLIRLPDESCAGQLSNEFVYNIDLTATVYNLAGIKSNQGIHGQSLTSLLRGGNTWVPREYITCRYGHAFCHIDKKFWILTNIDGRPQEIFDLDSDPGCQKDISAKEVTKCFSLAWERLLRDAGGKLPDYRKLKQTDAIGQK